MVMSANTFWDGGETDFPTSGSVRQKLGHAVKCATMTAAMDEWQPWQFHPDDNHVELSADMDPESESVDPDGRELMIRCGEALFHLKLALRCFGCLGRVELFPKFDQAGLVARVHGGISSDCGARDLVLFEAMTRGQGNLMSWNERPARESIVEIFKGAMAGEKAWLEFSQCESSRNRLVTFAEFGSKSPMAGHEREVRALDSRVALWTKPLFTFIVRGNEAESITVEPVSRRAEQMTALAVIKTKTDDKHGWLAAGQAMARIRLQARASEISSQVFDQSFRSRYVREELRTSIGHKGFGQAIIGFGSQPAVPQPAGFAASLGAAIPSRSRVD